MSDDLQNLAVTAMEAVLGTLRAEAGMGTLVLVRLKDGSYGWNARGIRNAEMLQTLGRLMGELAVSPPAPHYACHACGGIGHAHGAPPDLGWSWTPTGVLLCPACFEELCPECQADLGKPARVLRLVRPSDEREKPLTDEETAALSALEASVAEKAAEKGTDE